MFTRVRDGAQWAPFTQMQGTRCAHMRFAMRACGAGIGPSLLTEDNLQRLNASTAFLSLLAATHEALQRREGRGLPELFSNLSTHTVQHQRVHMTPEL